MKLHEQYTQEIRAELNYVATWLPTLQLAPGDVCTMTANQLQVVGSLEDFKIPFEVEDAPVDTDIEYSSDQAVSIQVKASGEVPPAGSMLSVQDAGLSLTFGRTNAVLLRMAACTSRRIRSLHQVGEHVLALHARDTWPDGYVVVTQVVRAGASTIIISQGDNAGLDLVAKGGMGQGALTLASLDASLQVKRESRIGAKFISQPGLTPLVLVSGVRGRFLRKDVFKGAAPAPGSDTEFATVDYADYPPGSL